MSYMTEHNMTEHNLFLKKDSVELESKTMSNACKAWAIVVKLLNGQELSKGETINTPEIQAAIKAVGGSRYLSSLDVKYLPSIKKDFIAAYNQQVNQ